MQEQPRPRPSLAQQANPGCIWSIVLSGIGVALIALLGGGWVVIGLCLIGIGLAIGLLAAVRTTHRG